MADPAKLGAGMAGRGAYLFYQLHAANSLIG